MKKGSVSLLLLFILYFEAFSASKCESSVTLNAGNHQPLEEQANQLKAENDEIRKSWSHDYKNNGRLTEINDRKEVGKAKAIPAYGGSQLNRPRSSKNSANSNLNKLPSFHVTRQMLLGLLLTNFFFRF